MKRQGGHHLAAVGVDGAEIVEGHREIGILSSKESLLQANDTLAKRERIRCARFAISQQRFDKPVGCTRSLDRLASVLTLEPLNQPGREVVRVYVVACVKSGANRLGACRNIYPLLRSAGRHNAGHA
jgi:hypothetical protein